ncbi:MAG: SdiA-regulated domain-containing protein [Ginsengibacter sp.]
MLIKSYLIQHCAAFLILLSVSCQTAKQKKLLPSPPGFDLQTPVTLKLNSELDEISGISFYQKDSTVFGIEDEDGIFFKIDLNNNGKAKSWHFDKKRDYEDVALVDSTFYVLVSNGDIETIQFKNDSILTNKADFPNADKHIDEFESLYYDDSLGKLIMLCKECQDDKKKRVTAWSVDIKSLEFTPAAYTIDVSPIKAKSGEEKFHFKPSAATIDPVTNELYILSAVNKLLVIADRKGNVKEVYNLDPKIFKQPEGITFTPSGDLLISNEAAGIGAANILIFKRKKKGK